MKKILTTFAITFSILFSSQAMAVDPKLKIVGSMAGYGIVGGALSGAASLAFGTGGRSVARGASLGLYAGLLFGGYIVLNYEMKKRGYDQPREDYYPDSHSPYEDEEAMFLVPDLSNYRLASLENKKDPKKDPLIFVNFLHFNF